MNARNEWWNGNDELVINKLSVFAAFDEAESNDL